MHDGLHTDTTEQIVGAAIEVHRHLGPGLLESPYEAAMAVELELRGIHFEQQVGIPMFYKGHLLSEHRLDLLVNDQVIVEIKSVKGLDPIYVAQVLTYLRVTGKRVGLLLNFNSVVMKHGIRRIVL
jgi:GxxExxY protein